MVGLTSANRAFSSWLEGETVQIVVGDLVSTGIMLLVLFVAFAAFAPFIRFLVERGWAVPALVLAFMGLGALLTVPPSCSTSR